MPIYQEIFLSGFVLRFFQRCLSTIGSICLTGLLLGICTEEGCLTYRLSLFVLSSLWGYFYLKTGPIGIPIKNYRLFQIVWGSDLF